jgi:hypothetical protein
MQLDRVPPRLPGPSLPVVPGGLQLSGTADPSAGVCLGNRSGGNGQAGALGWRIRARHRALVGLAALALLGQGERCVVDPRFSSPSATLATYWSALRDGDDRVAAECVLEGGEAQPFPGMLWFMPPTREVRLGEFRSLPVTAGRLFVTYEVRFRPLGALEEQRFQVGQELVRTRGEWRIARGLGPASLPQWRPIPRSVDI